MCNFSILLNRSSQTRINRHFFFEDIQQKNVQDDTLLKWVQDTCFHTGKDGFRCSRFRCGGVPVFLSFDIKKCAGCLDDIFLPHRLQPYSFMLNYDLANILLPTGKPVITHPETGYCPPAVQFVPLITP